MLEFVCDVCKSSIDYDNCVRFYDYDEDGFLCILCWDDLDEGGKTDYYRCMMVGPTIYKDGHCMGRYYPPRVQTAYDLMAYLNEKEDYRTQMFDCGDLGVVQMAFSNRWQYQWFDLEPLPDLGERE